MFTLSELWSGGERQGSFKLLKPWWEVFMDYLLVLMLMVSILAGTLQLSRDGVVCVPVHASSINYSSPMEPVSDSVFRSTPEPPKIPAKGRRTNLDFQQYIYISQVCYHEALPWYSRFLPYVTLLHTLVLLASGCFWFHFPLTSARIEHFPITSRQMLRIALDNKGTFSYGQTGHTLLWDRASSASQSSGNIFI